MISNILIFYKYTCCRIFSCFILGMILTFNCYGQKGEQDSMIQATSKMLEDTTINGLSRVLNLQIQAQNFKNIEEFDEAKAYLFESRQILKEQSNATLLAENYLLEAEIDIAKSNIKKATEQISKALDILDENDNRSYRSKALKLLGDCKLVEGENFAALEWYEQSAEIRKQDDVEHFLNLARVYEEIGDADKAILNYYESINLLENQPDTVSEIKVYIQVSKLLINQDTSKARQYAVAAVNKANVYRDQMLILKSHDNLSEVYYESGKSDAAYKSLKESFKLKDSIKQVIQDQKLQRTESKYLNILQMEENEKLKTQNLAQEKEIGQKNAWNLLLLASIALGILLTFLLIWYLNKFRKANHELHKQKELIEIQNKEIANSNDRIGSQLETLEDVNLKLEELNREKDYLISVVAHDLQSPLQSIRGLSDLITLSGPLQYDQKSYIEMINTATETGKNIIRDLLDINSYEQHGSVMQLSEHNLNDLSRALVRGFLPQASKKGIKILLVERDKDILLKTDKGFISRILQNLISNAVKFSATGKEVYVGLGDFGDHVSISVKDNGPGIREDEKHKLFKKFQKLSNKPTGSESSTGLGLAIVKTLVDRLGGTIKVISEVEKGTEFLVTIPKKN